jgi:hypothetical protein
MARELTFIGSFKWKYFNNDQIEPRVEERVETYTVEQVNDTTVKECEKHITEKLENQYDCNSIRLQRIKMPIR